MVGVVGGRAKIVRARTAASGHRSAVTELRPHGRLGVEGVGSGRLPPPCRLRSGDAGGHGGPAGTPRRSARPLSVRGTVGICGATRAGQRLAGQTGMSVSTSRRGKSGSAAATCPGSAAWAPQAQLVEDRRAAVAVRAVRVRIAELGEHPRRGAGQERRDRQARAAGTPRAGRRGRRAGARLLPRRRPSRPSPAPTASRRRRPCWRRRRTPTARRARRGAGSLEPVRGTPRASPASPRPAPTRRPDAGPDARRPGTGSSSTPSG